MPNLALIPFRDVDHPVLDVFFVHGLGGSTAGTWRSSAMDWPAVMADKRRDTRVWGLDYPAEATKWTTKGDGMDLRQLGNMALDHLVTADPRIGTVPVVFVAHSLGGLLVKQMLRIAKEMVMPHLEPIWLETRGVAYLATPHSGSDLASFADRIWPVRPTSTTLDLKANSTHLSELGTWYRQNAPPRGIVTAAYGETLEVKGQLVVEPRSADPAVPDCLFVPLPEDHISISKPASETAAVYVGVNGFLDRVIAGLRSPLGRAESALATIDRAVAQVRKYSPALLSAGGADTGQRLQKALDEVEKTYVAVTDATQKWLASSGRDGGLDPGLIAQLITGNLETEIHDGRGSCHKIAELYWESEGIRDTIDQTSIPDDEKTQVHQDFQRLAEADIDLFVAFEQAGGFMQYVANEIDALLSPTAANAQPDPDAAAARLRETRPEVLRLASLVGKAKRPLSDAKQAVT